jgi:hypothetical protein
LKTIIIILFLLANYTILFSQTPGWNNIDTTDIPNLNADGEYERIALFANHYGIHVLVSLYNGDDKHVTYYRMQTTGELDTALTYAMDDYGNYPNIVGNENTLYAVYRKDDSIKVHTSANGGTSWSSITPRTFLSGDVDCNGVDAAYSEYGKLHIVWSEKVTEEVDDQLVSHYESYFNRYTGLAWASSNFPITDHATLDSAGGFPTITTSLVSETPRAHVSINSGTGDWVGDNFGKSYSRDFNYTTWSDPVVIVSSDSSRMDRLLFTEDDTIHSFSYVDYFTPNRPMFEYRKKSVTSSTWGSKTIIDSVSYTYNTHKIQVTKTSGDILHAFWWDYAPGGFYHKKKHSSATSWSTDTQVHHGTSYMDAAVTSVSNDLYVLLTVGYGGPVPQTNYKYRQYDDVPLAPINLTVGPSGGNHPLLEWDENYEPDLDEYYIYRYDTYGGGWQYLTSTDTTEYEDTTLTYCTAKPPAQCPNDRNFYFRVTAVDLNSHESEPSDSVVAKLVGGSPDKISLNKKDFNPVEYSLQQNYPNPFNPTTNVSYSIKKDGLVSLKVYDILGTEVATLVNQVKPAGNYSASFDASELPSGIYIYKLQSGKFVESKKMILLK